MEVNKLNLVGLFYIMSLPVHKDDVGGRVDSAVGMSDMTPPAVPSPQVRMGRGLGTSWLSLGLAINRWRLLW